jgi:ApbE superfamily uncharacterized protein (UPF0280 family)
MTRARCARLADGQRLHLQDGPIDIVLRAYGAPAAIRAAEAAAFGRFATILDELCAELALLRAPAPWGVPCGTTARRMAAAVAPYAARGFITPMAAVAGAVADEILLAMTRAAWLDKAYVNNGGDIAVHLSPGARFDLGIVARVDAPGPAATSAIAGGCGIGGVATSGWPGRSFSLGIADAVTILAGSAAAADAAATIVANAVDSPGHPAIRRQAANALQPDCDLGAIPVTTGVGHLTGAEIAIALGRGVRMAEALRDEGRITAAALFLQGAAQTVGDIDMAAPRFVGPCAHLARLHA